jgi:hypothetical protein
MKGQTTAERCKRHGSQGAKVVRCVRCSGDIQPFAGRKVSELREQYVHQPGQCTDHAQTLSDLHTLAGQRGFAWACQHVSPGVSEPEICSLAGMGLESAETYREHFKREHGATELHQPCMIKLRKKAAAPKFSPVELASIFKRIVWTSSVDVTVDDPEMPYGKRSERLVAEHRGQFWSAGDGPHSVWAIEDLRGTGRPNQLVQVYSHGDGTWSEDWSRAGWDRKRANRAAKRAA